VSTHVAVNVYTERISPWEKSHNLAVCWEMRSQTFDSSYRAD